MAPGIASAWDGGPQSRSVLLAVRVAWFALPLTAGPALAHGLRDASTPVQVVASALAWSGVGCVAVAVLVPRTVSLTALRIGAPAALAASIWAAVTAATVGGAELVAIGWTALLAAVVLFVPVVTDLVRRRLVVRTRAAHGAAHAGAAVPRSGRARVGRRRGRRRAQGRSCSRRERGSPASSRVASRASCWCAPALRSLHQLSRRWVVFVRVGFVLHDPLAPRRPGAVPEPGRSSLGPAPADAERDATDLTGRALGLALECACGEGDKIGVIDRRHQSRTIDTDRHPASYDRARRSSEHAAEASLTAGWLTASPPPDDVVAVVEDDGLAGRDPAVGARAHVQRRRERIERRSQARDRGRCTAPARCPADRRVAHVTSRSRRDGRRANRPRSPTVTIAARDVDVDDVPRLAVAACEAEALALADGHQLDRVDPAHLADRRGRRPSPA